MEQWAYYLCLFLSLLLPIPLLNLKLNGNPGGVRLPPGPWRLPVIGSLHHLAGNPLVHRVMADLARRLDAPLMYLKLGEVPVVVATSPKAAREIMRTHDVVFATRPWSLTVKIMNADGQGLIFARYGALWRQLRKICILELLSARRVQSFRHIREEEVARFVAAVVAAPPGEPVNVSERIAVLITDSAVRAMTGDRFKRREEFLQTLDEGVKLVAGFNLGDLFPSSRLASFISGTARLAEENHRKSFELMEYAIQQHEQQRAAASGNGDVEEGGEDLVDTLLRIRKEGGLDVPLTMGMIKSVILDLFGAGSETSATTLQWAMSELMRYPNVMLKAQTEVRNNLQGKTKVRRGRRQGVGATPARRQREAKPPLLKMVKKMNKRKRMVRGAAVFVALAAMAVIVRALIRKRRPRITYGPMHERDRTRFDYLNDFFWQSDVLCKNMLRFERAAFFRLCDILRDRKLLEDSPHLSVEQQLAMFLHTIGHNLRNRVISANFCRSYGTTSIYFRKALHAIGELRNDYIRPPSLETPTKIAGNHRFDPYFKDCIGAIDGTHVRAGVNKDVEHSFRGRKAFTTQNVMAAVDFDKYMNLIYDSCALWLLLEMYVNFGCFGLTCMTIAL